MNAEIRHEVGRITEQAWYEDRPFTRVLFQLPSKPSFPAPLLPCPAERGAKMFAADPTWDDTL